MGCCQSAPAAAEAPAKEAKEAAPPKPQPTAQPPAEREVHPTIMSGVLHISVSQATYGSLPGGDTTPMLVRQAPGGHTFVALFEGLGADQHAVAAFCHAAVFQLYQESSTQYPENHGEALKATVQRLDAAIFAADSLPHASKVGSGAACVLLLLERGGGRAHCASLGAARCLLSRISGSFNAKQPEGFFLTPEHTTSNLEEAVLLQRRTPAAAPAAEIAAPEGGEPGGKDSSAELTRALGFMAAKKEAGKLYRTPCGALLSEPSVVDQPLSGPDQQLVLASSAFWRLVGPTDCALRAHFHEKFARRELDGEQAAAAAAAAAGGPDPKAPSPSLMRSANTGEHLVYWCLEKAARRMARLRPRPAGQLPPSVDDVRALPTQPQPVPAWAVPEDARQLVKSDVHGELGVVVVTLRRQDQSMDTGVWRDLAAAAAARAGAAAGAPPAEGAALLERQAARRWAQIRMLVDFHKAHRRVVLGRWWEAQDALFRRGRVAVAGAKPAPGPSQEQLAAEAAASAAAGVQAHAPDRSPSPSKLPRAPSAGASPTKAAAEEAASGVGRAAAAPSKVPSMAGSAAAAARARQGMEGGHGAGAAGKSPRPAAAPATRTVSRTSSARPSSGSLSGKPAAARSSEGDSKAVGAAPKRRPSGASRPAFK